eukprot:gene30979-37442_t
MPPYLADGTTKITPDSVKDKKTRRIAYNFDFGFFHLRPKSASNDRVTFCSLSLDLSLFFKGGTSCQPFNERDIPFYWSLELPTMMETDEAPEFVPRSLVILPPRDDNEDLRDITINRQPAGTLRGDFAESFAEMVTERPAERDRPLIIVDAANVGWAYGKHQFMAEGVEIAIHTLQRMQIDVLAFLPVSYVHAKTYAKRSHHNVLQKLIDQKLVSLVPSGESDDAYILNYARAHNAFIISNDMYRDHLESIQTNNKVNEAQLLKDSFEVIVRELMRRNRPHLLEHVFLTRAFLALEDGDAIKARQDVDMVLRHINPSSFEAQILLKHCSTNVHGDDDPDL